MIWLTALGWLNKARQAMWGMVSRYPLQTALIVAVLACGWLWRGKEAALHRIDAMEAASKQNAAAAEAQRKAIEAEYVQKAKDADHVHTVQLDAARAATARYIATHSLRGQSGVSTAPGTAQGDGSRLPESTPTGPVVVTADDLNVCAADYAYAKAAYEWAKTLPVNNSRVIDANNTRP